MAITARRVLQKPMLAACMLLPVAVFSATPQALQYLTKQIDALDTQLNALNQHIEVEQQKQKVTLQQTGEVTRQMLSLSRWPMPLMTLTTLTSNSGNAPQLLAHLRSQTETRLQQQQARLQTLIGLREQAGAKASQIAELQRQFEAGTSKLSAEEKIAVLTAASSANTLALNIESALTAPLKTVDTPTLEVESLPAPNAPKNTSKPAPQTASPMPVNARPRATTTGLLFLPAPGANVSAARGGKVLYAGPFRQFGGLIIIETAPRTQHVYAGLGRLNVEAGQTVAAGQGLGQLPGKAPVHLYWEIRKNGKPLPAGKLLSSN
ncbi:MAG TPA: peptidoglycan DD-metalloendopeptidase family protein [Alphaproteobacteria bacterium]|nr:peptidoglycan DD-metalloendopeptidase family protein [Alphaproteobacteria bacterium]